MNLKKIISGLFPKSLWNKNFVIWWATAFTSILVFTLIWCYDTTFRTLSIMSFYPNNMLLAMLLCLPTMLSKKRWIQFVVLLLFDALMEANLMYCRTYFNAIPAESYLLAGNLTDFMGSVWDSMRWRDVLTPLVAVIGYVLSIKFGGEREKSSWRSYGVTVLCLLVLSFIIDLFFGGWKARLDKMSDSCYYSTCVAPSYTVFGFVLYDALYANQPITEEQCTKVEAWLQEHETFSPIKSVTENRRNLVIIFCESFETWPIGLTVDGQELTPFLNSEIADSTTLFVPNVATQVGAGRSIDAQLLLLAGMYPMNRNVYSVKAPSSTYFTIPKAFKEHGGQTWIMTCDRPHVWNQNLVAKAFGLDNYLHDTSWTNDQPIGTTKRLSDGHFMEQSVEKMKHGEIWPENQYAFVMWVTYSGHSPFELPDDLKLINFDDKYPTVLANYMTDINYTDHSLKTLIDYLKTRSDWENTTVAIVGDHEGLANHRNAIVSDSNCGFVSRGRFTPLIVLNSPVAGRVDKVVGQVDIYPTLLQLVGLEDYTWRGLGQSILDSTHPGAAINYNGEIITNGKTDWKIERSLRTAQNISDLIIRYDLLKNR